MPNEIKSLSPEEVDVLERMDLPYDIPRFIATVRDRERQRDESLALNRQGVCTYCGHVETIPEGEDRTEGIRRIMAAHIENCPQHPLKRIAEIVEPLQKERDELQRQIDEVLHPDEDRTLSGVLEAVIDLAIAYVNERCIKCDDTGITKRVFMDAHGAWGEMGIPCDHPRHALLADAANKLGIGEKK